MNVQQFHSVGFSDSFLFFPGPPIIARENQPHYRNVRGRNGVMLYCAKKLSAVKNLSKKIDPVSLSDVPM